MGVRGHAGEQGKAAGAAGGVNPDPPSAPLQVIAHAYGRPHPDKQSGTVLPWTYDESIALLPGLRAFVPEFRAMSDEAWKEYAVSRVPPLHKERVAQLKGELPPEGLWPEFAEKVKVRWGGRAGDRGAGAV